MATSKGNLAARAGVKANEKNDSASPGDLQDKVLKRQKHFSFFP